MKIVEVLIVFSMVPFLIGCKPIKHCVDHPMDIVFVLDSSSSIWPPDFFRQLGFVENITGQFNIGPTSTRIGVITFSDYAKVDLRLGDSLEAKETMRVIQRVNYLSGGTNTAAALDLLSDEMFLPENGGRHNVSHIAVVVTDGESHDTAATAQSAKKARGQGIKLLAIGVGPNIDEEELKSIATDPDDRHIFKVTSYQTLQNIVDVMVERTCEVITTTQALPSTTTTQTTSIPATSSATETIVDRNDLQNDINSILRNCGGKPADIYFLLDSSSSILPTDLKKQTNFVKDVVDIFEIGASKTRVGVSTFSDRYEAVIHLDSFVDKTSLLSAIDDIPYLKGGTDTAMALERVRKEEFADGKARKEVAHILIVMTDGLSRDARRTAVQASLAKRTGMYIFVVGIGQNVDQVELQSIASPSDNNVKNYVFSVTDFEALKGIKNILAIRTCEVAAVQQDGRGCTLRSSLDVMFAFDTTSFNRRDRSEILLLASRFSQDLSTGSTVRVGITSQACIANGDVSLSSNMSFTSSMDVDRTDLIVRRMYQKAFDSQNGGRADARKMAFVIVDGAPSKQLEIQIKRAKFRLSNVHVIAIGKTLDAKNLSKRLSISRNDKTRVYTIESTSALQSLNNDMKQTICDSNV